MQCYAPKLLPILISAAIQRTCIDSRLEIRKPKRTTLQRGPVDDSLCIRHTTSMQTTHKVSLEIFFITRLHVRFCFA
jgi:hypothetical protein